MPCLVYKSQANSCLNMQGWELKLKFHFKFVEVWQSSLEHRKISFSAITILQTVAKNVYVVNILFKITMKIRIINNFFNSNNHKIKAYNMTIIVKL